MRLKICPVIVFVTLLPIAARAETLIEAAAGYNVVNYRGRDVMPAGWFASIAAKPNDWFAIATELSAEFETDNTTPRAVQKSALVFLDGPRFILNTPGRVTVFGETLVGVAHDRDFLTERASDNHFVWQPGAGVDAKLSDRVSARFQVGVRYGSCCNVGSPSAIRFSSGVVITSTHSEEALADIAARRAASAKVKGAEAAEKTAASRAKAAADLANRAAREFQNATSVLTKAEADLQRADAQVRASTAAPNSPEMQQAEAVRRNALDTRDKAMAAAHQADMNQREAGSAAIAAQENADAAKAAVERAKADREKGTR